MKSILFTGVVLLSASAMANDSGMPYIEVQDLTFKQADIGTSITFRGPEAMSLFNSLPSQNVLDNLRGFTATGKKKSVVIECSTEKWLEKQQTHVPIKDGPECQIRVEAVFNANDGERDNSKWIKTREPQSTKATPKKEATKK